MAYIENFEEIIEECDLLLENVLQPYYQNFIRNAIEEIKERYNEQIDNNDNEEDGETLEREFLDQVHESISAVKYIIDELEKQIEQDQLDSFEELDIIKRVLDYLNQLLPTSDNENYLFSSQNQNLSNKEKETPLDLNIEQQNEDSAIDSVVNSENPANQTDEFLKMDVNNINNQAQTPDDSILMKDIENLSKESVFSQMYDSFLERHQQILEKIENLDLEVSPKILEELSKNMQNLEKSLTLEYEKINTNIIDNENKRFNDITEILNQKISEAIENNKVKTQLDIKSKMFLFISGISSVLIALTVSLQIFVGISYYQGYVKYNNLMGVIEKLPPEQKNQIASWISDGYQGLNRK